MLFHPISTQEGYWEQREGVEPANLKTYSLETNAGPTPSQTGGAGRVMRKERNREKFGVMVPLME